MTETHATTSNKEMENKKQAFVQDEIKTMASKIESKKTHIHASLDQLVNHLMDNKFVEASFEPHKEETSSSRKDHPYS